jgi:flagellar assembly factor FliW
MRKQNIKKEILTSIGAANGILETKLGAIHYTQDDIFSFNDGLVGFPNKIRFTLTDVPGIPTTQRYGMLQSLDDNSLSFIVYYPALDEEQQKSVLSNVRKILEDDEITSNEIGFAFLVVANQNEGAQANIEFVTDAPLVFLSKTQEAWQMVNEQVTQH